MRPIPNAAPITTSAADIPAPIFANEAPTAAWPKITNKLTIIVCFYRLMGFIN
jgi:hypothetical protein